MKIYVDPACNINYCSFYIKGLWDVYGKDNVILTSRGFESLHYTTDSHYLAFRIDNTKYVIDCADSNALFYNHFLEWADVYGKVNYLSDMLPEKWRNKIKPVGANFGIGCFGANKWSATAHCIKNYLKSYRRLDYGFGSYLSAYLWLYKRASIRWKPQQSRVGLKNIFMVSRYWHGQPWVNDARIAFIRACRRLESEGVINFTGGMVPDHKENECPTDVILPHEIPFDEYVSGMRDSLLVFNTPAYHHCHGWKLPEYLATGKIILSTPFVNELPHALEHKNNIYFSEVDEESLYQSIKEIVLDSRLQGRLEEGSRRYWTEYASPRSCLYHFIYD
ncbi:glycosyltransferase [Xylanibacter rodentium]|uniref:glycosyltransferase n=1 Tax=Xylanibacter rodentium TaxID=2736289 RepID=UPI0011CE3E84|nr:hypothetical protein [Xylanibacter rodentium]